MIIRHVTLLCVVLFSFTVDAASPIDRQALVRRHSPVAREYDALAPLTVGNGEFAFTADVTGLQTFPESYNDGIPLSTQSNWGWHSFPNPDRYSLSDVTIEYDAHGRPVPYASETDSEAAEWLRSNPHRLGLARIGFVLVRADGTRAAIDDLQAIEQRLNLWTGTLDSRFDLDGQPVRVRTSCHPDVDQLAVHIESPLVRLGRLSVAFEFPYGSGRFGKEPEDWSQPEAHETRIIEETEHGTQLLRTLDDDSYYLLIAHRPSCRVTNAKRHRFELAPPPDVGTFEFSVAFSPCFFHDEVPSVAQSFAASGRHWEQFWSTGGAIDFTGSTDPRAKELERRVVLSQYLTAIQCAGSIPPQETGLTLNSWYGKFHLEMHWWHAAQFALWGRTRLLEKSLPWYKRILPMAQQTACGQGYRGARWPKMVGPDGREGPSNVGVFLIWQQPHPVYYSELCYRSSPTDETLQRYREVVFETAEFMASYADWNEHKERYELGPPLIPAQECYDPKTTRNPTFELEYWHWGLETAQRWRERLGLPRRDDWEHVLRNLSMPAHDDRGYETAEGIWRNYDHPSYLAACGVLPGWRIDTQVMRRSLDQVLDQWNWERTWGWDYPMAAMTAARLGVPETAIDLLMMPVPKNRYLKNGHNWQSKRLPLYLPGNGGLLAAVAMMAAGWDGAPKRQNPGFPDDGRWSVRWEGLNRMP